MGKQTFDNIQSKIGGPLPGRINIVLTLSRRSYNDESAQIAEGIDQALNIVIKPRPTQYMSQEGDLFINNSLNRT